MDNSFWVHAHGGLTHFPIALLMVSAAFDLAAAILPDSPDKVRRLSLRAAGFYTLMLAALGACGAVVSGLLLSHGEVWGKGNMARHHVFLWPAFGLLLFLAVWRLALSKTASAAALRIYLAVVVMAALLMGAAGFWGGELLLNG